MTKRMIRNITALFFISMANIILLAHVLVPHHHHTLQVCVTSSDCQDHEQEHSPQFCHHNHQNDAEDCEPCVFKQILVIPANGIKKESVLSASPDVDHDLSKVQFLLFYNLLVVPEIVSFTFSKTPVFTPSLYTTRISHHCGLRAPPIL